MDMKKYLTNKYWIVIFALICSILWGSAFPTLKTTYAELNLVSSDLIPKIVLAGMRFFIASLILFFILKFVIKQPSKIDKRTTLELLGLGLLQTSLQYFFFYNGLAHISGMKGAILSSSGTFFVVLLAHFIYSDDKMSLRKTFGLVSGLIGIVLVNLGKGGFGLDFSIQGEGFLIMAGLVSAFGTFIAKRLARDVHPVVVTAWQMFLGSIVLISFGLPNLQAGSLVFTTKAWMLLLYSAVLSATSFALWYSLLKYNKAGEITLYKFMVPIAGTILSVIFLQGEQFNIYMIIALAFVSSGIIAVNYKK